MYDGVINVYKEPGFTSFDVVAKLRGILKQKKIGHTGTLDPDAEGVLVVCLGKATKLCDILTDKDKSYVATLLLGVTTDTEDISGKILSEKDVHLSKEQVKDEILSFIGAYDQIPPMYSAIKVNGKKLYELARQGQVIERTPRHVVIHDIEILSFDLPRVTFRVSCGKGTYIRSLCRDIGEKLGVGGVMEHLVRDCVVSSDTGKTFDLKDALTLAQIEGLVQNDTLESKILAIDTMFPYFDKLYVNEEGNKKLSNGNILKFTDFANGNILKRNALSTKDSFLVYDLEHTFKAIYCYEDSIKALKPDKMFL
ncbi:MAG: tRNA pseudouridine(55) synthase TruB [Lachnospiraceae bacterium]